MKTFLLLLMTLSGLQNVISQSCTATITAGGPTTFCEGSNVVLTANGSGGSGTWTQKANLGSLGRQNAVSFSIGNKGYLGTGLDGAACRNDFWEYDPTSNAWTQKANFGGGVRWHATGFSIGSKGYMGTGSDLTTGSKNDFWEYDPTLNTWTQKANFGGSAREGAKGFSIGNKGYLGTGFDPLTGYTSDFWEYDPSSNAWTQKADFFSSRYEAISFSGGNKGYLGIGGAAGGYANDLWEYDPSSNAWTQKAYFGGTIRGFSLGLSIGNKGYIGTGLDPRAGVYKNDFWEFDPNANTWIQKTNFGGSSRGFATGFSIGNKGYIGTGIDSSIYKNDLWEFDLGYTYLWSTGETTPTITAASSGSYTVTITNNDGCSSTSEAIVINVNPISIVQNPTNKVICNGATTTKVTFTGSASGTIFNWTNDNPSIGLAAGGKGDIASFTSTNSTNTPITATVTVTPSGGFAYIPIIADTNHVSVINLATNTVVASIHVGSYPLGVSVSPDGSRVYITNHLSSNVSVINTATNTVVATVPVGISPAGVAISPDGSLVYVANAGSASVTVINTATNSVVNTIAIGRGDSWGVAISPDGNRLYVTGYNSVTVINTATNTIMTNITVGIGPIGVCVSPDGSRVYTANYNSNPSTVSVINTATNTVVATVGVGIGPFGISISPDGSRVYAANSETNDVSVINTANNTVVASVGVGNGRAGVSVSPDGSRVYVGSESSNSVYVINTATNLVVATIPVGANYTFGNSIFGAAVCTGAPKSFTITVNPTPDVTKPSNQSKCNNVTTDTINFTGGVSGTEFKWTNDNTSIGLAASGTGNIASFTAINTSSIPQVANITVTPGYNGCTGTEKTFTITINPASAIPIVNVVNNCGNSVLSTTAAGTILWSTGASTSSITVISAGTYTVTQTVAGCVSTAGTASAAPKALPSTPIVKVDNYCGSSILSTTSPGPLLWSNGSTRSYITVYQPGTYSVTLTQNGCTSAAGFGTAAPKKAPLITAANIIVSATLNDCSAAVLFGSNVTVTGIPTPTVLYKIGDKIITSPYKFPVGSTSIRVIANNSCGTSLKTFLIKVTDNQNPTIDCKPAAARTVRYSTYTVSGKEFDATASDNCGHLSLIYSLSGATVVPYKSKNTSLENVKLNIGTTTITWKATDESNLISTCNTIVTVKRADDNSLTVTLPIISNTLTKSAEIQKPVTLIAKAIPNPSVNYFTLELKSNKKESITIKVRDVAGRMIEKRTNIQANSTLQIGNHYAKGVYFAEIRQGTEKVILQLIKEGN